MNFKYIVTVSAYHYIADLEEVAKIDRRYVFSNPAPANNFAEACLTQADQTVYVSIELKECSESEQEGDEE